VRDEGASSSTLNNNLLSVICPIATVRHREIDMTVVPPAAIFLDRDGTINMAAPPGKYIRDPTDLKLLPGAAEAVRLINSSMFKAILVTNQRWLSEPTADPNLYIAIETRLAHLLAVDGARLDASYVCPHALNSCNCRKPSPGMLLRASVDYGIDLSRSFVVGDSITDVQAGLAVGATTVLIASENSSNSSGLPHFTARSIKEAIDWSFDVSCSW
jgi:D-glycero-D-manno-heptose 1,7-bisphosphate phosphatase